ncbi:rhodanese-like domain-containing protein [Streptomyces sp. CLV115]|uniref:rhodanese-like domain-containing protein n=1 Tax=Streptomyces sp. CLV115 TaxID=3138502 RepID=UPI00313D572F
MVDVRPAADYAAGHIPGSASISLRDQFATWLGRLLPDTAPLAFATGNGQDLNEIVWQAYKIGYERLAGRLRCGRPAAGLLVSCARNDREHGLRAVRSCAVVRMAQLWQARERSLP